MSGRRDRSMPPGGSPYTGTVGGRRFCAGPEGGPAGPEKLVDRAVDPESHNLHAGVGERCMICDQVIRNGRWVRRTISGGYVHDSC